MARSITLLWKHDLMSPAKPTPVRAYWDKTRAEKDESLCKELLGGNGFDFYLTEVHLVEG